MIALFGVFLGYLLWPFRFVITNLFRRKKSEAEAEDTPEAEPAPQADSE